MGLSIKLFWKVFSALLFVIVSGTVLFFAYGYRYDFEGQEIQKTSIIDFQGKFADVAVVVDGDQVVSAMPYQFKGILPGIHKVEIRKEGFHYWERNVKVIEDRVSIVEDVLLVPESMDDYESEIFTVGEDEEVHIGDGYLLVLQPGEKVMKVIIFGKKGKVSIEDIQLFRPVMSVVGLLPNQKFLLQFDENLYSFVDLNSQKFNVFYLPENAGVPKIDIYEDRVLFKIDDVLYRMPFNRLVVSDEEDLEPFLISDEVTDFAPDYFGGVYFVKGGELFYSNGSGEEVLVKIEGLQLEEGSALIKNIAIREAGWLRTLIVRTESDRRLLYILDNSAKVSLLCDGLVGIPYYANSDVLAYVMGAGDLFIYDYDKQKKIFVFQDLDHEFSFLGWYANWDYLLLKDENAEVYVVDRYNKNRQTLKSEFAGEMVQTNGYSLYTYNKGVLQVQYFEDVMRKVEEK